MLASYGSAPLNAPSPKGPWLYKYDPSSTNAAFLSQIHHTLDRGWGRKYGPILFLTAAGLILGRGFCPSVGTVENSHSSFFLQWVQHCDEGFALWKKVGVDSCGVCFRSHLEVLGGVETKMGTDRQGDENSGAQRARLSPARLSSPLHCCLRHTSFSLGLRSGSGSVERWAQLEGSGQDSYRGVLTGWNELQFSLWPSPRGHCSVLKTS